MRNFLFEECSHEERIEKLNSIAAAKEAAKQDVVISERESKLNKINDGSTTDM